MSETSKGARTRQRILHTAATLFSEKSFEQVSLRSIARNAHVDPALINHYFGSKEGLFAAVLDEHLQPAQLEQRLGVDPVDRWGRELVLKAESVWVSPAGRAMLAMVRRAFAGNPELLRTFVTKALLERIASHIDGPDDERRLRASLVASQMSGLIVARHVVRVEPLASLTREQVADLVGPNVQRYLTGPLTPS